MSRTIADLPVGVSCKEIPLAQGVDMKNPNSEVQVGDTFALFLGGVIYTFEVANILGKDIAQVLITASDGEPSNGRDVFPLAFVADQNRTRKPVID